MSFLVKIKDVTIRYGSFVALEKASLTVCENDFIGVIGPNGGGKTSLLKAILGLLTPSEGTISFSDAMHEKGSSIGYLPQVNKFDSNYPISVTEVIVSGLTSYSNWYKKNNRSNKAKAYDVMDELGILHLANKPIGQISGGQMQRVFLARALISDPRLLILDEPDTYVDYQFENQLYEKLKEVNKRMAIILVSHDVGTISAHVKSIACVSRELNHHMSNIITPEQLKGYNCPIQIITHGDVPHTVLAKHSH